MLPKLPPLRSVLVKIKDWRKRRGKRYRLEAILLLLCVGLLCGKRGPTSISRWAKKLPYQLRCQLGFRAGIIPSASTLCRMLWHLDVDQLEQKLSEWVAQVNTHLAQAGMRQRIAIDGKKLRGALKRGGQRSHLLSAVDHQLKTVLAQLAVEEDSNEIRAILPLLEVLHLNGCIVTVDAILTQREVAQTIVAANGYYVMFAKDNQPTLKDDIETLFVLPPVAGEVISTAKTINKGHGRLEIREIETTSLLKDFSDWPGLHQSFKLTRTTTYLKAGQQTTEVVYGFTNLPEEIAPPACLLEVIRGHWTIENQLHWVRDVSFGEDAASFHKNQAPHAFATLRNLALTLIRAAGFDCVPEAFDTFSAQPALACQFLGLLG